MSEDKKWDRGAGRKLKEKLKLSEISDKPWIHLIVDFIMKLSLVVKKNIILVVCNRLSKMIHIVATTEEILQKGWHNYLEITYRSCMSYQRV